MHNYSQASANNRQPILKCLKSVLTDTTKVLEIGSGSGQHAIYFASRFPDIIWQPTELGRWIKPLALNIKDYAADNVLKPFVLDVCNLPWPVAMVSCVYTANTVHIMHWKMVESMFMGVGQVLQPAGLFCIYGPFRYGGEYTTASNAGFDQWLKQCDPNSGIRDIEAITQLAVDQQLCLIHDFDMPANNQFLVFKKVTVSL